MNNTSVGGGFFSHDDSRLLVHSNESGIYNVYSIDLASGERTALTQSDSSSVFAVSFFPEDDRFLYRMDDNGNEIYHLYLRDEQGQDIDLTPAAEARAIFYGWADDRSHFYYGYSERDPRLMDVYAMDVASLTPKMIYANDGAYEFNGISPDGRYLALSKPVNTNDSDLFIYDLEQETMQQINQEQASHSVADFAPDGQSLYYRTDAGAEFSYVVRYNLESGERAKVWEKDWDVWAYYFSHRGKYRVASINADGKTQVFVQDVEAGVPADFPEFERGNVAEINFNDAEDKAIFYVSSSSTPTNLYYYDLSTEELTQLTDNLNPEIDPDDLVAAEVVRFPSFDGLAIPAIYYKPKQAKEEQPAPALVWVHGGPGGQTRQQYSPTIQYLVNHGYAILAVNNRGSSGYGKSFYRMDDQRHGEEDLQDCIYGKKWLAQRDYIDSTKIGIIGGSYGGFMVMAALTREPQAFDVGVNLFGVTNWLRTLRSIPPWWESFKDALYEEMGDPSTQDSTRLYEISPLFHADKITKPVMVLQGAQDPRVLQIESDEIVEAVRENDVPVEYVLFEDEGHGFVKKANQIEAYGKILEFLEQHLRNKPELEG